MFQRPEVLLAGLELETYRLPECWIALLDLAKLRRALFGRRLERIADDP